MRTRFLCTVALAALAMLVGRVGTAAAPDANAPIDVSARWHAVLDQADPDKVYATLTLVPKVAADGGEVDAAACRQHAQEVDDALKINTVGLGLWYAAYRCAVALHDEEKAAARLQVFSALVRYAVDAVPDDFGETPIGVLSPQDVDAFVMASGQELLYIYYDPPSLGRYLTMHVSLWDAERKRERLLHFDYLENRLRMMRNEPDTEFPGFRSGIARGFIKTFGKEPGSWAAPTQALEEIVTSGGSLNQRLAKFESLADRGDFSSAMMYSLVCQTIATDACAAKSVETILPWAEKSYSLALITLALAYEHGNGVKRNEEYASKLIEAADRRLGDAKASIIFAGLSTIRSKASDFPPSLRKTLEQAAAQRKPMAELTLVAFETLRSGSKHLDAKYVSMLGHAAAAGLPRAQSMMGAYLIEQGNVPDGLRWIQAAAAAGEVGAQGVLAGRYQRGEGVEKNPELARHWYGEAGRGGNRAAMLWMARYYAAQPASAKVRNARCGWLESAVAVGSVDAALELAELYREGGDGVDGSEKEAVAIYRSLDSTRNNAEARRRLAAILINSKTTAHDLTEARRLLQVDADRGDIRSRVALAEFMTNGVWGQEQVAEGRKALQKAAEEGDVEAMVEYGIALYYGSPPQRKAGLDVWQQAADKGSRTALNNLAWGLCTADEPAVLDGKRGLEVAKKLSGDTTPLGYLDTLAACHAAAGDFTAAATLEKDIIAKAEALKPRPDKFIELSRSRVALYERHQTYREVAETKK